MSNLGVVMKPELMLELLENAAEQLAVRVSYESLTGGVVGGHGGLCKVKGEFRCIIDKRATSEERVVTLATALARFDLSQLEVSDKVRELVRTYEQSSKHRKTAA